MIDSSATIESIGNEWQTLDKEFQRVEDALKSYQNFITEFTKAQNQCFKEIHHQKYRINQIKESLKRCNITNDDERNKKNDILNKISQRLSHINDIQETLPKSSGLYLRIVMGGINTYFLSAEQRLQYKEQYEKFKLIVTSVILFISLLDLVVNYRAIDSILNFLLVWYHCTLTIRESILVVNGSRIKGWWRILQFIHTVFASVMIVWPDGDMYNEFRVYFLSYICYRSFVQFLQFYYQHGCLYRLRSLGLRYDMDITIQGFHSWMWKGLGFLIPFLYSGYAFQLFNGYILYKLSMDERCVEWQVPVASAIFLIFGIGNTLTTSLVIFQKLRGESIKKPKMA